MRNRILAGAAGAALLLALGACGTAPTGAADAADADEPTPTKAPDTEVKVVETGDELDTKFAAAFAETGIDSLGRAGDEMTQSTDALNAGDIPGGLDHAVAAADVFDEMVAGWEDDPATLASQLGRDTMATLRTCSDTYHDVGAALESLDTDELQASADGITDCTSGFGGLSERLHELAG